MFPVVEKCARGRDQEKENVGECFLISDENYAEKKSPFVSLYRYYPITAFIFFSPRHFFGQSYRIKFLFLFKKKKIKLEYVRKGAICA